MRDVIKIFAAGSILTAYALIAPTIVEAVPSREARAAAPQKLLTQRLLQAGGDAPASGTVASRMDLTTSRSLPRFARYEGLQGVVR